MVKRLRRHHNCNEDESVIGVTGIPLAVAVEIGLPRVSVERAVIARTGERITVGILVSLGKRRPLAARFAMSRPKER